MERPLLHGTDGIRGSVGAAPPNDIDALNAIIENREVNGRAFMLLGMAFAEVLNEDLGRRPKIVIGWDRRPGNAMLVSGLTDGLHQIGAEVIHGGLVATPGLHNSVIGTQSDAGLMVTASHNPSTDSGVKFFDARGRKSMPEFEQRVANIVWKIAEREENREPEPELCRPDKMVNAENGHRNTLAKRFEMMAADLAIEVESINFGDFMVGFLSDDLEKYISAHSESGGDVEKALRKETLDLGPSSGMMSGDSVGNFLKFIVKTNKCKRILEIGTFTGYSALMLASELPKEGELITCDINSETSNIAKKYWAKSSHGKKIKLKLGPAIETMEILTGKFDLIFIDADKNNYLNYYKKSKELINENGIIIIDNVLWSGRVLKPEDKQSISIDNFNKFVNEDKDFWNTIVPIRDGLMVVTRR